MYEEKAKFKCWECGKLTNDLTSLLNHYKSHDIEATCHICKITFRRLVSLSTHLENAHLPPKCSKCCQLFSNVWELNKHAEARCAEPVSRKKGRSAKAAAAHKLKKSHNFANNMTVERSTNTVISSHRMKLKQEEGLGASNHSLQPTAGENDDEEDDDGSTTSESDAGVIPNSRADDDESDGDSDSSSTDCSSGSSTPLPPTTTPVPPHKNLMCTACGRGPYRSIRLHQRHCHGVKVKYQCFLCKQIFLSEEALKDHQMPLYSCHTCGQVFSHQTTLDSHPCPKDSRSPLMLFCAEAMPKVCNICKSFFTSEKTLAAHVTRVHVSLVSTKVCIITKPSLLSDEKMAAGVHNADGQSPLTGSNQAFNGKLPVDQTCPVKLGPSSTHPAAAPVPLCLFPSTSPDNVDDGPATLTNQHPKPPSLRPATGQTDAETTRATAVPDAKRPPSPTILALFENDSLALARRTKTSWRLKATYPCRQCGAILRHTSLIISHRYLHRGQRSHRCQCGRSFKHRLHLLRHCVQHAEAVNYICVSCGDTFIGAKLLAQHLKFKSSCRQPKRKSKGKRKCRMTLRCDCGLLFFRPSAFIWHQLKNKTKS